MIGRWLSPDPYGQYNSPYVGMGNDWAMQVDPDGGFSGPGNGFWLQLKAFFTGSRVAGSAVAGNQVLRAGVGAGARIGNAAAAAAARALVQNTGLGKGYNGSQMKPASAYDYSQEEIEGKFSEDWKYIGNGQDGNGLSRAWNVFQRDWGRASGGEKAEAVLSLLPVTRIGKLVAKGGAKLLPMISHSTINNVLKSAQMLDRNGLSEAGRALQKHSAIPGPFRSIKFLIRQVTNKVLKL